VLLAKIEVGLMAALPGGDVAMRHPEEADMPMAASYRRCISMFTAPLSS
jgi:hypothetical protein